MFIDEATQISPLARLVSAAMTEREEELTEYAVVSSSACRMYIYLGICVSIEGRLEESGLTEYAARETSWQDGPVLR